MKRTLTKLALDALFIGACLWLFWNMTGCGSRHTSTTRSQTDSTWHDNRATTGTTVTTDNISLRSETATDSQYTRTIFQPLSDSLQAAYIRRYGVPPPLTIERGRRAEVGKREAVIDRSTITDSATVHNKGGAVKNETKVKETERKTDWLPWIITLSVVIILLSYIAIYNSKR